MSTNEVKFYVDDKIFTGWKSVNIQRNVDSLCGSFSLDFFDKWDNDATKWPLIPNRPIKIVIGNERVITGFIDELSTQYDSNETGMSISGRDKACDLVDCSAVPKEYSNLTADKIAKLLLSPFGLELIVDTDPGEKFAKWTVKPGDTVFENLDRIGKARALFFVSDEYGFVRMQKRGSEKSNGRLVRGENIKDGKISYNNTNRFNIYKIVGQSAGSDESYGDNTVVNVAQSLDAGVNRYRPLILQSESNADKKSSQNRANWELSVRIASAVKASVVVYGWTTPNGRLWKVNELVNIKDDILGLNGEMLISSVNFKQSDGDGTTTELELVRKESFLPEPEVIKNTATLSGYEGDE